MEDLEAKSQIFPSWVAQKLNTEMILSNLLSKWPETRFQMNINFAVYLLHV